MRALRYYGTKDIRLEHDVPEPQCGPRQVKIRPAFVGICGSDLHEYLTQQFIPTPEKPHPVTGEYAPLILGHEFSGTVVEVGSELTTFTVGNQITVKPTISCQKCNACQAGYDNCCAMVGFIGLHGGGGGLSDFVCVDERFVFALPDNVPLDTGALVEPLAVAWRAVRASGAGPDDEVLVLGAGPIGAGVVQCLKAKGIKNIIVSEVSENRQKRVRELGATHVFDPKHQDVVEMTKAVCANGGPRIAIDCAGVPPSIRTACVVVQPRGIIVNVAVWMKDVLFQPNELVFGEKTYTAVLSYQQEDFEGVLDALKAGHLKPSSMITKRIAVDQIEEEGFKTLLENNEEHLKILIDMTK